MQLFEAETMKKEAIPSLRICSFLRHEVCVGVASGVEHRILYSKDVSSRKFSIPTSMSQKLLFVHFIFERFSFP